MQTLRLSREQRNSLVVWAWILAAIAALLFCFTSCAGLGSWLAAPAGQAPAPEPGAPAPHLYTFSLPHGGSLSLPGLPQEPTSCYVDGVGLVTITPDHQLTGGSTQAGGDAAPGAPPAGGGPGPSGPPAPTSPAAPGPTNADAVAQVGGTVVGGITGNLLLGTMAANLLAAFLGRRKQAPTPTV